MARRAGQPVWTGLILIVMLITVTACGQPLPTPTDPVTSARTEPSSLEGRLLFARGGNIWTWSGGQETQVTDGGADSDPRWSADGTALLFIRRGESYSDLWLIDLQAGNARRLTANQSRDFTPGTKEYVDASFFAYSPTWGRSPEGKDRIIYSTDREGSALALWIMNGLGSRPGPVLGTAGLRGHIEGAAIAPDGRQVAFTYSPLDPSSGAPLPTQIYVIDLNTGQYHALTDNPLGSYDAAWSPDGQWIAYASRQDGGTTTSIWVMRANGSDRHRLTDGDKDRGPAWSPEGNHLAFVRIQSSGTSLFSVDLTRTDTLTASKAQPIGNDTDIDAAAGLSWTR